MLHFVSANGSKLAPSAIKSLTVSGPPMGCVRKQYMVRIFSDVQFSDRRGYIKFRSKSLSYQNAGKKYLKALKSKI